MEKRLFEALNTHFEFVHEIIQKVESGYVIQRIP